MIITCKNNNYKYATIITITTKKKQNNKNDNTTRISKQTWFNLSGTLGSLSFFLSFFLFLFFFFSSMGTLTVLKKFTRNLNCCVTSMHTAHHEHDAC